MKLLDQVLSSWWDFLMAEKLVSYLSLLSGVNCEDVNMASDSSTVS